MRAGRGSEEGADRLRRSLGCLAGCGGDEEEGGGRLDLGGEAEWRRLRRGWCGEGGSGGSPEDELE